MRMDLSEIRSLLVIKPSSLGDVIHTLPAVNLIKRQFPHLEIRWLIGAAFEPLLEGHPSLAGLVPFPREEFRGMAGWIRACRWARGLRALKPDVALDFQGLLRSALMGRCSGARRLAGMPDAREGARFLYDEIAPAAGGVHAVERYFEVAEAVGARRGGEEPAYFLPEGNRPPKGARAAALPDAFVLLHPFSRGRGKALTPAQVTQFCEELAPVAVAIVGTPGSGAAEMAGALPANGIDLTGATTLLELLWLIRRTQFTVSVDSGPMHLAAAVTSRLLGIHTWTDPRKVGPYRADCRVWKGGVIRRVRELEKDDPGLEERRGDKVSQLGEGDVAAIAAVVRGELLP